MTMPTPQVVTVLGPIAPEAMGNTLTHDHVLIDAGPVGMAGRGGHGHNDCLAFDAMLDGVRDSALDVLSPGRFST